MWIISIDKRGIDVRVRVDGVNQVKAQFQGAWRRSTTRATPSRLSSQAPPGRACEEEEGRRRVKHFIAGLCVAIRGARAGR